MAEHPIQSLMQTAMENLKEMVDVNTIIGDPIESGGSVILPISRVGFGFAAGGSEFDITQDEGNGIDSKLPFGGGSGGGISINPIGFLVIHNGEVKLLSIDNTTHIYERMLDMAPEMIDKIRSLIRQEPPPARTTPPPDYGYTM